MMTIDGKTLAQCFEMVAKSGSELEGLITALKNLLVEKLEKKGHEWPFVLAGDFQSSDCHDDSDWVYTDVSYSLPLKSRGQGKKLAERYLGFQISMLGDGIAVPGQDSEPLLHVFCWEHAVDFDDGYYLGFPLERDDTFDVLEGRLLTWGTMDSRQWNSCAWAYSLKLLVLNNSDDLKKYVIDPAFALLTGLDVAKALPEGSVPFVRYPSKDDLQEI